jgi:hypothetical protein
MPHKDRDNDSEERPSERRHRTKSEKTSSRPHRSSKSSKSKIIDPETGDVVKSPRRHRKDREKESDRDPQPASSMADLVPELTRTASTPGSASRTSLPYPSFNKAFSREAVNSREDIRTIVKDKANPYTPESTDVGSEAKVPSKSTYQFPQGANAAKDGRPPSPPETEFSQQKKATPARMSKLQEDEVTEERPSSRSSWFGRIRKEDDGSKLSSKSKISKASTAVKAPLTKTEDAAKIEKQQDANQGSIDNAQPRSSNATLAPKPVQSDVSGQAPPTLDTYSSPDSAQDSSPMTPTPTQHFPPLSAPDIKPTPSPSPFVPFEASEGDLSASDSPQPPPPPPPPAVPINVPRVDYLLQNGGLLRPVSKQLLSTTPNYLSQNSTPRASTPMPSEIERIFGPFYSVLDQYETVINKNGSLAVATGYRSVARRLLDRLENVFNRDLSPEGCACVMCQKSDEDEGNKGLGWGEVLEWVSGRRELPIWPAFDFATLGVKTGEDLSGLGLSDQLRPGTDPTRPPSPVKIDPDVAEEFREHYLQQSKKTKLAVNKWLSSCPQTIATPPQEVDDETLSFAIVTHLEQQDRPIFNAILSGSTILQPSSRAPTPLRKPRTDFIMKTVHSLQRLYRLPTPPRDPEAAIYLVKNPHIHHLVATLSGISTSEWEILTSGRFDGFLWSGAESDLESPAISRGPTPLNGNSPRGPVSGIRQGNPSRTTTPFSAMRSQTFSPSGGFSSRGPTPFSQLRHPVSNDEETEIAVLAEVEREIYLGMEMLEDAFEGLHCKAELVRRALRERGAGLSMAIQSRRTSHPDIISASTPGIPPSGMGLGYERPQWGDGSELASESDCDAIDELQSELAPDDSASNISSSRHRRPKRRNERRTPAVMEEQDES